MSSITETLDRALLLMLAKEASSVRERARETEDLILSIPTDDDSGALPILHKKLDALNALYEAISAQEKFAIDKIKEERDARS